MRAQRAGPPRTAYREKKIGNTLFCVTNVFTGEKPLGETLEKLAAQRVLNDMANNAREIPAR